jgi:CheY-like chemotaxis protein
LHIGDNKIKNGMAVGAILVVEDEQESGELVVLLLTLRGHEVRYAKSGSAAMEMLADPPLNLIVTDIHMPGVDGAELVRRIRTMKELAAIPILVMSAMPEDLARKQCPLATAFLPKAFTALDLLHSVRQVLASQAQGLGEPPPSA